MLDKQHINAFTIDLEDWFYTDRKQQFTKNAFGEYRENFYNNTFKILEILSQNDTKATFFVLGIIAEKEPDLIKEIQIKGHEIANHGYSHRRVNKMTKDEFSREIELSGNAIIKACGSTPIGFRAPYFSITEELLWAFDVLTDFGYIYDSSVYHRKIFQKQTKLSNFLESYEIYNGITEFQLSSSNFINLKIPCSGGAFFRFYPYNVFKFLFAKSANLNKRGVFYIHPWELSHSKPKQSISKIRRFREFYNIDQTNSRLIQLFNDFSFTSIKNILDSGKNEETLY